jgi:hypothetical protein
MPPSAEEQVQFLLRVQQILSERLFTATYKYALLMALSVDEELPFRRGNSGNIHPKKYNIAREN